MRRLTFVQPFLFAAFPILSLFASNLDFVRPGEVALPIAIVTVVTALLFLLGVRLMRDVEAAAISISVFWFLFLSYGRLLSFMRARLGGLEGILLLVCLLLLALVVLSTVKQRGRLHPLASILNVMAVVLVAMPLTIIAPSLISRRDTGAYRPAADASMAMAAEREALWAASPTPARPRATATAEPEGRGGGETATPEATAQSTPIPTPTATPVALPAIVAPANPPDIYYIILDGYARADVLQDLYDYDNNAFLAGLAERGFYVAPRSRSNYIQTYLSLSSSLNMVYLDGLAEHVGPDSEDRKPLQDLLRDNIVAELLRGVGYTYVAVSTGYAEGELSAADLFLSAGWSLSQFQTGLLGATPLSGLIDMQHEMHRERLLYAFDRLPEMARMEGPVFVLAHIAAPHPPFVFGENGEKLTPDREFMFADGSHFLAEADLEEYVEGYRGQLHFIGQKVEAMLDAILANSPEPPIIILQADHGPGSRLDWYQPEKADLRERLSILNAYHLPGDGGQRIYDHITPVNTFRVIFGEYFGANIELLPDESYYSTWPHPYRFIHVPAE